MNSEQLEAFVYTVYLKSTNKAAKTLFISQPTVTARIQTLEKELGKPLFERQGKSLSLNDNGQQFFKYAQQILQIYRESKEQINKEQNRQEIRLGANMISSQYIIPHVLQKWEDENPYFKYHLIATSNDELVAKLIDNEIDLAVMAKSSSDQLSQRQISQNKIELVVYPDHPFASRETIGLNDLIDEPLTFFACGAFDWSLIFKLFETSNIAPFIKYHVDQLEIAKSFIIQKRAIGFIPSLSIKKEIEDGTLKIVKVDQFPSVQQPLFLTTLKGKSLSEMDHIAKSLLQFDEHIEIINN